MKIAQVLSLINENNEINFGHTHFSSADEFMVRYYEEEETLDDGWADNTRAKCEKSSDFIQYKDAKALYDKLSNGEKKFVAPRGKYIDSPKLVFRLGEKDGDILIGFVDVYYFPDVKDDIREGFIIMAVDPAYRGRGVAKKLISKAAKKAKEVGFDSLKYEVDFANKHSINFIQKFADKFKNETPKSNNAKDERNLTFRYRFEKEEDEMTSAILGGEPGAQYAEGDFRTPAIFGKVQKRKKEEDAETGYKPLYRFMDIEELNNVLAYNAFTQLLDFDEDANYKVENPAGPLPFFKSFTTRITRDALNDFMGDSHIICVFDARELAKTSTATNKTKLLDYVFDDASGAIHEYEVRLFSEHNRVPVVPSKIIKEVIFCKQSGYVEKDDIENLLLDLRDSGVNAPVSYIANPLTNKGQKIKFALDENDELVSEKLR